NNISRVIDLKSTPDFQPTSLAIKNLIIADGKTKAVDKEGAGAGIRTEQKSSLTVENSKFINNTVSGLGGGAIYSGFQSNATIINSQFENNDASQAIRDSSGELSEHAGGAILMWSESNLTVKGSEFRNNTGINGGAINNLLSNLTIEYSTFINNNSTAGKDSGRGYGGAIYTDGASNNDSLTSGIIRISNSRFQDNEAAGQGGGMFLFAYPPDQIIVENSQILNNQVIYNSTGDALGGGIRAGNAELTITNTSFANNTALSQGGGLWIGENSPTEIINSTFSGNRAESEDGNDGLGGAISLANGSNSNNIINTTIANNYAGFQGGAFWGGGTNTTLKNTIVAYNVANNGGNNWNINHHTGIQFNDGGGNIQSNELNPDDTKITAGVTLADPLLGGLQQINDILVHPLLANSPAIDAGVNTNAPTKDQLGNIRSVDGDENGSAITDIGAYEFSTTSSLPTATDNLPIDNNIIGTPGKDTLTGTNAADTMLGDEGNDTYIINDIRDVIIEDRNAGRDKVKSSVTYSLKDNIENLMLTEAENIHGTGNSLPNYIAGNDNHNKLIGANGHDTLLGVGGEDTLIGSRGNDILIGGTGDDILEGRLGRDRLNGGPGNDTLTGGASIDRFIFNSNRPYQAEDIGRDIITDFRQDQNDLILLDKRTFTAISSVAGEGFSIAEEFEIVSSDAEAIGATGAIIYNQNNGNLFYNSDGMTNGLGEGGLFATLDNSPALESGDFMIR
ncbi:MAG: choice-of-anchor Q domain-containing protein, partial [Microcoleaceae cyanobacterium MO_207.B10]|nr:choice-of-anchor Q domain-containing protein [Microcoleaceae cyanobacterium MO_207.B10]